MPVKRRRFRFSTHRLVGAMLLTGLQACSASAQVATAPFAADRQITNPAILSERRLLGHSLRLLRETELSQLPAGSESNLEIETKVDTAWVTSAWEFNYGRLEIGAFPQQGQRATRSRFQDISSSQADFSSSRSINLVPLQLVASSGREAIGSVGVKALYTSAQFSTNERVGFRFGTGVDERSTTGSRAAGFLLIGIGAQVSLFPNGLRVAGAIESQTLFDDIDSTTNESFQSPTQTSSTVQVEKRKSTAQFRKSIVGLGYSGTWSGREKLRVDFSAESMPSLEAPGLPDGRLYRLEAEAGWEWFQFGLELVSRSGYTIDPRSLIPYFFSTQDMTGDIETIYGFFGGFKSSRGHSLGLSYSQSSRRKKERFSQGPGGELELDNRAQSFGLSYLYAY